MSFPITAHAPQLLISVTTIEEAKIALDNGADVIDLKDPSAGALGALPIANIQAIVAYVSAYSSQKLTSATIGDLPMLPELLVEQVARLAATNVDIVKVGFFEVADYQPCLDALHLIIAQAGVKLIAVLFAEYPYPAGLIAAIKQAGFIGVMLDTADKNGLTLIDYYAEQSRDNFAKIVFNHGLQLGLAGSLKLQHIATLKAMQPTYIGFRGGVCEGSQRTRMLNAEKISAIRKTM